MTDVPVGRVDRVVGRGRDVCVTLSGLWFRDTTTGRRYPYPDFGSDFIEALHAQLARPERRGLLRSTLVCPWCNGSLDGLPPARVALAIELTLARVPPIQVELEIPGMTCPGCRRTLVGSDDGAVDSDLSDALIDAFTTAGVRPG